MTGRRLLGFGAAAALVLSACGSSTGTETSAAPAEAAASGTVSATVSATGSPDVPEILRFSAPLLGGGTYDGAAAAGKVTAYWFWAPT